MAAIDKMYLKSYDSFTEFRIWCMTYKPSLLRSFYYPFLSEKEWNEWKEDAYNSSKERLEKEHSFCDTIEHLKEHCIEVFGECSNSDDVLMEQVEFHNKYYNEIQDKVSWIEDKELPVACFRFKDDKFLKWFCPIKEVREYLETQCGVKTKWYHKLFFKGKYL